MENSYFGILPNEILIKILENVSTFDLFQFCEAYRVDDLVKVKTLVGRIDLGQNYKLRNLQPIVKRVNHAYIKTLNINCLYWIRAKDLRNLLRKLVNLETLLAIDTELDLRENDINVYRTLKLKKLAISVRHEDVYTKVPLPSIQYVFIKFFTHVEVLCRQIFPNVKVLWFEDTAHCDNGRWVYNSVDKLLYRSESFFFNTIKPFEYITCRPYQTNVIWFDAVNFVKKPENVYPEEWNVLHRLHVDMPYPYKTYYALKEKNIDNIMLDELNFQHRISCSREYRNSVRDILLSDYTKDLKKLSIATCFLICECCNQHELYDVQRFKRIRLGVKNKPCPALGHHFLYNFRKLEVLEIYICSHEKILSNFNSVLPVLSDLKYLKYLSFEMPMINNGKFLISMLNSCRQLEVLKIISKHHNDVLNINLYKALINGNISNLKDFKFENRLIPISRILEAFSHNEHSKLERISIICDESDLIEYPVLERFFDYNPQLIFLYFRFNICHGVTHIQIKSILTKYKKRHPASYFVITRPAFESERSDIPDVHFTDMVLSPSIVCLPNAYNDFETF